MSKKNMWELGLWATCLLTGSTVLYAQWRQNPIRPAMPEFAPVVRVDSTDFAMDIAPASAGATSDVAVDDESPNELDSSLVARLLVESVMQVESAGNPRMVGSQGERGLMQIKAGTWGEVTRQLFGSRVPFNRAFESALNKQVGAAYLDNLQSYLADHRRQWRADERSLLLACYNAGPERVKRSGFDLRRLPAHTQDYVKRASALHDALLAEHNVDPSRVRFALADSLKAAGGS